MAEIKNPATSCMQISLNHTLLRMCPSCHSLFKYVYEVNYAYNDSFDTYNQKRTTAMAGAPVTMQSVLQSLTRYATPAKAMRDNVQQYQREVPMKLRCLGPTSSAISTKQDIPPLPETKERIEMKGKMEL